MNFECSSETFAESAGRTLASLTYICKYKNIQTWVVQRIPNSLSIVLHPLWITPLAFWGFQNHTKLERIQNHEQMGILGCSQIFPSVVSGRRHWMGEGEKQATFRYVSYWNRLVKNAF